MSIAGLQPCPPRGINAGMILLIRLLRPVAYLFGIAGALLVVNTHDVATKQIGWALIIAMVPVFITVSVLTSVQLARQKKIQRRR